MLSLKKTTNIPEKTFLRVRDLKQEILQHGKDLM